MCSLEIPKAVIKQIDKFRKNCLWRGNHINVGSKPKAAWELVCKPKEEGGLGIINLESQNQALLMKFLDKFFNKKDIPWVNLVWEKHYRGGRLPGTVKKGSFWWRDVIKLLQKYKDMVSIKVNNGSSCLFWLDSWDSTILKDSYPQAFSFAKNKNISVYNVMNAENITELFQLPLSQIAFDQCYEIETRLNSLPWDQNIQDQWKLGMSSTSTFKSATAYKALMGHQTIEPTFKWTWKSFCQPKYKVFFWLLLHDRLNTRNILRRKQMQFNPLIVRFV